MAIEEWTGARIPDHVLANASIWIARLDDTECSPEDYQNLQTWLTANAQHRQAFEELSFIWAQSSVIKSVAEQIEKSQIIPFKVKRKAYVKPSSGHNILINCPYNFSPSPISASLLWSTIAAISTGLIAAFI
jgi:ferric-dicitrate binding protein FerR (iron transport regulator)